MRRREEFDPNASESMSEKVKCVFQLGAIKASRMVSSSQVRRKDCVGQSYACSKSCHLGTECLVSVFPKRSKKVSSHILFLTIESLWLSTGKWKSTLRRLRLLRSSFNMFVVGNCIYFLYVYVRKLHPLACLLWKIEFIRLVVCTQQRCGA